MDFKQSLQFDWMVFELHNEYLTFRIQTHTARRGKEMQFHRLN